MDAKQSLLLELDRLKTVLRRSYIADGSRRENTAEHSWHLAIALMALAEHIPSHVNLDRTIQMALVHDVCEIGAGDISVYDPGRAAIAIDEAAYVEDFRDRHGQFGATVAELWAEYEAQQSPESQWLKVVDRLLPFLLNLATDGRNWREQSICRSQVLALHRPVERLCPDLFRWMRSQIDSAVDRGWLIDA